MSVHEDFLKKGPKYSQFPQLPQQPNKPCFHSAILKVMFVKSLDTAQRNCTCADGDALWNKTFWPSPTFVLTAW